jgi:transcriptional regulator with XRE-family HTH domain
MASTETSFELVVRHHLQAVKEARVHNLYLLLLHIAIPHSTVHVTLSQLAQRAGISITTVKRYLKTIAEQKPWLSFRPAGRAGIAIYYRPDRTKPQKRTKKSPSSSLKSPSSFYKKDSINDAERHQHPHNPQKTTPPTPKTKLPRARIWSPQEWERRHWMKLWRRKSYTDPSMKWAARNGANLVRIIGHFTWHARVEFSTVKAAVKRWWHEFLYAGKALPARGKALFQCLFVRLNAWISKLSIKNVKKARPLPHPLPQALHKILPQPAGA